MYMYTTVQVHREQHVLPRGLYWLFLYISELIFTGKNKNLINNKEFIDRNACITYV